MPDLVPLRELPHGALDPLLEEEKLAWRSRLHWDFSPSAELVRRFVRMQALGGTALLESGLCKGYCYFVTEERKALLGDLFLSAEWSTVEYEDALLNAVLGSITSTTGAHRIEAQLMLLNAPFERPLPWGRYAQVHPRMLMLADLAGAHTMSAGSASSRYNLSLWTDDRQEEASQVIAAAYRGHIDSNINDQYRSPHGARRFLNNIVQYPGCGLFDSEASWVADIRGSHQLAGVSLASVVAPQVGHITQICVAPEFKGTGCGYELMRRSLNSLASHGCDEATLTVTTSNTEAVRLYQSIGFRPYRRFAAYVWDGL
jgi:ribosomal protein S18 acetylase RimI-like enzyme